jgi:hypothetical protein
MCLDAFLLAIPTVVAIMAVKPPSHIEERYNQYRQQIESQRNCVAQGRSAGKKFSIQDIHTKFQFVFFSILIFALNMF